MCHMHTSSTVFQVASSCVCTDNFLVGEPLRVLLCRVVACEGWLWGDSCGWIVPLPDWSSRLGFSAFTRTARVRFPDREILFVFCSFACLYLNIRIGCSSPLSLPITCLSRKLIIRWTNNTHTHLKLAVTHTHSLSHCEGFRSAASIFLICLLLLGLLVVLDGDAHCRIWIRVKLLVAIRTQSSLPFQFALGLLRLWLLFFVYFY